MAEAKKYGRYGDFTEYGNVIIQDNPELNQFNYGYLEQYEIKASPSGGGGLTPEQVQALIDAAINGFIINAEYNSNDKEIIFTKKDNTTITIDATPFVKDGMVDKVELVDGYLVITFNTDAGKEDISIELGEIFNPENYYTKTEINKTIGKLFGFVEYDSVNKVINFKNSEDGDVLGYVDATPFVKDGMVDTVSISNGNLVITFNEDADKEAISIALTDIFDSSKYYTKTEVNEIITNVNNNLTVHTSNTDIHVTTTEKENWNNKLDDDDIENLFGFVEYDSNTKRINFKNNASGAVLGYVDATDFVKDGMVQNVEIANNNLVITFNTDADKESITIPLTDIFNPDDFVDWETFNTKEEVISRALNELHNTKQDVLVSGTNIKTINDESLLGDGNITIENVQSDWNQTNNDAPDFINNKPFVPIIWSGTQAQFNEITDKDPNTIYLIYNE